MLPEISLYAMGALVLSAAMTGAVRKFALSRGVLDIPNQRSSHTVPIPRGGGTSIVVVTTAGLLILGCRGNVPWSLVAALGGGGLVVALVGFLDDRSALPAGIRLLAHLGAASWAVIWLGAPSALQVGHAVVELGYAGKLIAVLGIAWSLNLFNFMDGIDGIAGSQAVFVTGGAAWLTSLSQGSHDLVTLEVIVAAASAGFLAWNWPPARIFMGDVGSGYLGYTIGVLAIASARETPAALWPWLILDGVFLVDSTVTLLRRLMRGERIYEAHRTHAYQWQARRLASHLSVTVAVTLINVLWLLPSARAASNRPEHSLWIAVGSLAPLTFLAAFLGAGRSEVAVLRGQKR